jgi:anaerobic magnesium-protoporphyrin IX monomethyl ester cyclase
MAKLALVYPPMANPYAPYLSVPELAANLRQVGHDVSAFDFNLEAHDFLLTAEELQRAFVPLVDRFERLNRRQRLLTANEQAEYAQLAGPVARRDYLCDQIERVVADLHDSRCYTFDRFGESRQTLNWSLFMQARLLLFTSRVFNPSLYEGYDGGISCFMSTSHILGAIQSELETPIHRYYLASALPKLLADRPALVGISWTFAEQTMPTFLLAAMVKRYLPGTRVVIGGNAASLLHRELAKALPLHDYIDGYVVGDGEPALREMATQLDAGRWLPANVPNMRFRRGGAVQQSLRTEKWHVDNDPPPDFDGLPLDRYYVGTRQLVYMTGRGCYYNKCKFCNFPATKPGYQGRSPEKVAADLEFLARRYDTRLFYIADDAVAPMKTYRIAQEVLKRQLNLTWWVLTRYDNGWTPDRLRTIEQAGCYRLFFGGESADTRLQEYTDKGFDRARIAEVLAMLRQTGLHVHMSTIVGFPTETETETANTIQMAKDEMRSPRFSGRVHVFRLTAYSGLAVEASSGVQPLFHPLNELAVNYAYYRVNGGTVREMLTAKERAKGLINQYNRDERLVKLHCYPETHTYEGLQFAANYRGTVPDAEPPQVPPPVGSCYPRMAPWVTTFQFSFPVSDVARWYRGVLRESEIEAFETGAPLEQTYAAAVDATFCAIERDDVLAVLNHKTDDRRYLDLRATDLLTLCDGTRSGNEILRAYLARHPEDDRAAAEQLLADLVSHGFCLHQSADHADAKPDGVLASDGVFAESW